MQKQLNVLKLILFSIVGNEVRLKFSLYFTENTAHYV